MSLSVDAVDIKKRIDETSKYIRPAEKTTDYAYMFIPADGLYQDLLNRITKFRINNKIQQILLTTTTLSSSKIILKYSFKKVAHQFFPIDNYFVIKKFINHWKPAVLFLCESEIWPNLINYVHSNKIKLILINGRITKRSFKRWKKIKFFSKKIFYLISLLFLQRIQLVGQLIFLRLQTAK